MTQDSSLPLLHHAIETSWRLTQLESGLGPAFFSCPFAKIGSILTRGWISTLWEFVDMYKLQLVKQHPYLKRFQDDEYIMRVAIPLLSKSELRSFNVCRLYLRIELLSDLFWIDGTRIKPAYWNGNRQLLHTIQVIWPHQPQPSKALWTTWQRLLQHIFQVDSNGRRATGHGPWHNKPTNWRWYFDPITNRVYERLPNSTIHVRSPLNSGHRRSQRINRNYSNVRIHPERLPITAIPASVHMHPNHVILENTSAAFIPSGNSQRSLWSDSIESVTIGDIARLKAVARDQLVIVGDGSVKGAWSSAAWVITSIPLRDEVCVCGSARTPGYGAQHNSHRAEVTSIMGALWQLQQLERQWNVPIMFVTIACDNDSALEYAVDVARYPTITPTMPDFDILQVIRDLQPSSTKFSLSHVKGHQDDYQPTLTPLEELNVRMDTAAKARRARLETNCNIAPNWNPDLPRNHWQVSIRSKLVYSRLTDTIKDSISAEQMQAYWDHRDRIPIELFEEVDWTAMGRAMKFSTNATRQRVVKFALGECGVNTVLYRRKTKHSDKCARCDALETITHVWKCKGLESVSVWTASIAKLKQWLDATTSSSISYMIVSYLQSWYDDIPPLLQTTELLRQDQLGCAVMLEGILSIAWHEAHDQYLLRMEKGGSSLRWITALIHKLWDVSWDLWSYRNDVEHKKDTSKELEQLDSLIADQIVQGFNQLAEHKQLFSQQQLEMVQTSEYIGLKRAWLRNIMAARRYASRHTTNSIPQMRSLMRTYLGLQPTPGPNETQL